MIRCVNTNCKHNISHPDGQVYCALEEITIAGRANSCMNYKINPIYDKHSTDYCPYCGKGGFDTMEPITTDVFQCRACGIRHLIQRL
jgi:hypothetical protein